MKTVTVKKASYTLPLGNRVVNSGEYSIGDFSKEEIEYLTKVGALKRVPLKEEAKVEVEESAGIQVEEIISTEVEEVKQSKPKSRSK
jgi:hypothetical protein